MKIARFFLTVALVSLLSGQVAKVEEMPRDTVTVHEGKALLSYIKVRCNQEGIPIRLVHNIIDAESNWKYPTKGQVVGTKLMQSREGAYGLMQIQVPTAREVMNDNSITDSLLMVNDSLNVDAGIRYLVWLRSYYKGNMTYAVSAYNRGIKWVNRDIKNGVDPLNQYAYNVLETVKFGKRTTAKINADLAALGAKRDTSFAQGIAD